MRLTIMVETLEFTLLQLGMCHACPMFQTFTDLSSRAMDINMEKQNESAQSRRVDDALEAQRTTEHFIDMVSHELRNPMSAMVQSADVIANTARDVMGKSIQ